MYGAYRDISLLELSFQCKNDYSSSGSLYCKLSLANYGGALCYFSYLIRRIFRIYPAYIFGIFLSLFLIYFVFNKAGLTGMEGFIRNITDNLIGIGSMIIMILILASPAITKLLNKRQFVFLGAVSYSFYLIHFPILLTTISLVNPLVRFKAISIVISMIVSFILSISISYLSYRIIELKFQQFGRVISNKLK